MTDRFDHPKLKSLREATLRLNEINRRIKFHQPLKKTSQWDWLQTQRHDTETEIEQLDYDLKELKLVWQQEKLKEERELKQKGWR